MSTLKKPDLSDPALRAKLAKGMGHNYYGEPAWPNGNNRTELYHHRRYWKNRFPVGFSR